MTADMAALGLVVLAMLLLAGYWLRLKLGWLQRFFIPASVIGGVLGLMLGSQVLGALAGETVPALVDGVFPEAVATTWRELPGLLITVVFASIFLGRKIAGPREIWRMAGPQIAFGQTLAWGQYVVGIVLVLAVLGPMFDMGPAAAALIEVSFEGGMGTASGLAPTFEAVGFPEARDLGVGLATIGLVSGLVIGIFAIRRNLAGQDGRDERTDGEQREDDDEDGNSSNGASASAAPADGWFDDPPSAGRLTTHASAIESLTLHVGFIALAIFIGVLLREGLRWLEDNTWGPRVEFELMAHFPLFPLAMIGSVLVQLALDRFASHQVLSVGLMRRINGLALDLLIASAIASVSLAAIGEHLWPFLLLAATGIAWNVFGFLVLSRLMFAQDRWQRALSDFGQSMGTTGLGLLLLRIADPQRRSDAHDGFAYKQIAFEPIVGGGLFTAASAPLLVHWGLVPTLVLTTALGLGWALFGWWRFGRRGGGS
jgi:glutamate:Na+ symporter, ESS family